MIYFRWFTVLTKGTTLPSEHNIYLSVKRNTLSILMPYKKPFKPERTMVSTKSPTDAGSSSEKGQSKGKKEEFEFFFGSNFVFSQFHPARFKVDGITYNCMEQYMHHQKAVTFKDSVRASEIMTTTDPKSQKKLGRQVTPFDKTVWGRKCVAVVKKGSLAKYRQNPNMKKVLFASYPKTLVEASPRDRLWGIGLGRNNEKAQNRATWRGKNLLGDTLTEVRNKLMVEEGLITGLESSVSPTSDKSLSGPSTEHHSLTVDQSKLDVMFEAKAQIKTLPELEERSSPSNVDYARSSLKKDFTPSKKKSPFTTKRKDKSDSNKTPTEEIKSSQANTSKESAGEETPLKDNYSDNKKRKQKLGEETPVKESAPKDDSSSAKKRKARSGEQDKHELSKDKEEHSLTKEMTDISREHKTQSKDKGRHSSSKERKERSEEQTTTSKEKDELSLAKETIERSGEENTQTKGKGEQSASKESKKRPREHKTPSKAKSKHSSSKEREETSGKYKALSKDKREHSSSKERKNRSREHNTPSKGKGEHSSSKRREERSEERKAASKEKREHSSSKEKTPSKDNGKDSSSKKRKERSVEDMTPLKDKDERSSSEARKEKSGELKTPSKDKKEHSSSKKKRVSEEEKTPLRDKGENGSSNNGKERSEKQPTPDRDGVKRLSLEMSDKNETPSKAEHLTSDWKSSLEENPAKTEQHKLPNVSFEFEKYQTDQEYPSASEEKKEIVDNKETLSNDEFSARIVETNDCSMSFSGPTLSEDKFLLSSEKIEDSSDCKETSMTEESDVCKTNVTADTQIVREHALSSRKRPWKQDEYEKLSNEKSQQSVKKRKVSTEDSSSFMKQTKITHFTIPDKNE